MKSMLEDPMKNATKAMDEAAQVASRAAGLTRSRIVDGLHATASVITMVQGLRLADALGRIGLQRRRSPAIPFVTLGAGLLAGAAAAVLLAPVSGAEARRWIAKQAADAGRKAQRKIQGLPPREVPRPDHKVSVSPAQLANGHSKEPSKPYSG